MSSRGSISGWTGRVESPNINKANLFSINKHAGLNMIPFFNSLKWRLLKAILITGLILFLMPVYGEEDSKDDASADSATIGEILTTDKESNTEEEENSSSESATIGDLLPPRDTREQNREPARDESIEDTLFREKNKGKTIKDALDHERDVPEDESLWQGHLRSKKESFEEKYENNPDKAEEAYEHFVDVQKKKRFNPYMSQLKNVFWPGWGQFEQDRPFFGTLYSVSFTLAVADWARNEIQSQQYKLQYEKEVGTLRSDFLTYTGDIDPAILYFQFNRVMNTRKKYIKSVKKVNSSASVLLAVWGLSQTDLLFINLGGDSIFSVQTDGESANLSFRVMF